MGMGDFGEVPGVDKVIEAGDIRSDAISEKFEQGFITNDERYRLTVENWIKAEAQVQDLLTEQMENEISAAAIAMISGARGNASQMKNCVGMFGVFLDASGQAIELPVKSSYTKGLTQLEYFTATRGTRKAVIDIALKTADAGYLTRRLVDVAQDVFTTEMDEEDRGFAMLRSDAEEIGVPYAYAWKDVSQLKILASTLEG